MHKIAVLVLHDFVPSDVATPCDVFARARSSDGVPLYQVRVCGEARRVRHRLFGLTAPYGLEGARDADTLIVAGIENPGAAVSPRVIAVLRAAARHGCRIASICTGAFVLAEAGLLDGLTATTHWRGTDELARRYPAVTVDPNVLFVDNGQILTSAGASAGLDLCLYMLRQDHGAALATLAAKLAVVPLVREGGQAQYIANDALIGAGVLSPLMDWAQRHLAEPITLDQLARRALTSPRTLTRRFVEQTGMPPLQWLGVMRVRRAQQLLETTALSVEEVATEVGFGSASAFREKFRRIAGLSPRRYRAAFDKG
ncbi:MAG: helix-turn-helix domain-containing protein [Paludibacterium sp.]|uniref:GlxA family transcriptional regulator n=1 Tax=Paludibacterium sp. TaxID=1917523 RepID=UPI0025DA6C35|nr:helix-turn-helix domain-containing protein [Paludibacterium sp.]MBV8048131.1 helix-turn-helix domain-containing protein [Paludibacterium sp.]MBV8647749.1 helix-turn-helix domain-containing protein [Paludibacterium sp.]